jgi:hypothetical protein
VVYRQLGCKDFLEGISLAEDKGGGIRKGQGKAADWDAD